MIGADAVDDLLHFIELKHARGDFPEGVTLTHDEVLRARALGTDYILAVVSGLEVGRQTTARLFIDPLHTLDWEMPSSVTLLGLRERRAIDVPVSG